MSFVWAQNVAMQDQIIKRDEFHNNDNIAMHDQNIKRDEYNNNENVALNGDILHDRRNKDKNQNDNGNKNENENIVPIVVGHNNNLDKNDKDFIIISSDDEDLELVGIGNENENEDFNSNAFIVKIEDLPLKREPNANVNVASNDEKEEEKQLVRDIVEQDDQNNVKQEDQLNGLHFNSLLMNDVNDNGNSNGILSIRSTGRQGMSFEYPQAGINDGNDGNGVVDASNGAFDLNRSTINMDILDEYKRFVQQYDWLFVNVKRENDEWSGDLQEINRRKKGYQEYLTCCPRKLQEAMVDLHRIKSEIDSLQSKCVALENTNLNQFQLIKYQNRLEELKKIENLMVNGMKKLSKSNEIAQKKYHELSNLLASQFTAMRRVENKQNNNQNGNDNAKSVVKNESNGMYYGNENCAKSSNTGMYGFE